MEHLKPSLLYKDGIIYIGRFISKWNLLQIVLFIMPIIINWLTIEGDEQGRKSKVGTDTTFTWMK